MKKTAINSIFLLVLVSLVSCSKKGNGDVILTSQINMEHQMLNFATTKVENNAHSGKYYSSVDSISQYGAGYSLVIADSLKDKNVMIYVKGWVREQEAPIDGRIAVAVSTTKGVAAWNELKDKNPTYQPGTWVEINDSVNIASKLLKETFAEISVFGIKVKGKDRFDLDDLNIKYRFYK